MFVTSAGGGMQAGPNTVAIVVNYRTPDLTLHAVRSLQESTSPPSTIIVVDNGSNDGSAARIATGNRDIQLIKESQNRGFAAGCNVGIREALAGGATAVLLLNSDARVSKTGLAEMESVLRGDERIGIVGALIVSTSPADVIESFGIRYSRRTGRMRNLDFDKPRSSLQPTDRRDVDAVSGCAMLVKRTVFERVGLFDEDYFFGFEDIDFCLRARTVGFLCSVTGATVVEHDGQASIGRRSPRRIYFGTRNHLLLARRTKSTTAIFGSWFQTANVIGLNLAHVLVSAGVPRWAGLRAFVQATRDYRRQRYGNGGRTWIDG